MALSQPVTAKRPRASDASSPVCCSVCGLEQPSIQVFRRHMIHCGSGALPVSRGLLAGHPYHRCVLGRGGYRGLARICRQACPQCALSRAAAVADMQAAGRRMPGGAASADGAGGVGPGGGGAPRPRAAGSTPGGTPPPAAAAADEDSEADTVVGGGPDGDAAGAAGAPGGSAGGSTDAGGATIGAGLGAGAGASSAADDAPAAARAACVGLRRADAADARVPPPPIDLEVTDAQLRDLFARPPPGMRWLPRGARGAFAQLLVRALLQTATGGLQAWRAVMAIPRLVLSDKRKVAERCAALLAGG